jgi:hypothetical protein
MLNQTLPRVALILVALASVPAYADDASYQTRSYKTETLGSVSGAAQGAGNPVATQTVESNTNITMIGHTLNALNARVESPAALIPSTSGTDPGCTTDSCTSIGGVSYTTVYSFNKALLGNAWYIKSSGYNEVSIGLAPIEVRIPFVLYAIGPLTLNVAPGVRFLADITATLTPILQLPDVKNSQLGVELTAKALAAGFVEAYASLIIIRGGVGGQVDLIDGHLDINGQIFFNGVKPVVLTNGIVQFFNGRIYAFLDVFGFLSFGWKRLIDHNLYSWNAICYSMGYLTCPAK